MSSSRELDEKVAEALGWSICHDPDCYDPECDARIQAVRVGGVSGTTELVWYDGSRSWSSSTAAARKGK